MSLQSTGIAWTDSGFTCFFFCRLRGGSDGGRGSRGPQQFSSRANLYVGRRSSTVRNQLQEVGDVVIHRLRRNNIWHPPDRVQLRTDGQPAVADPIQPLAEYRKRDPDDRRAAEQQPDDGDGCALGKSRESSSRGSLVVGNHAGRCCFRPAARTGVGRTDREWSAAVQESMGNPFVRGGILLPHRSSHAARLRRSHLPGHYRAWPGFQQVQAGGRGGQRSLLALRRLGLDVYLSPDLLDVAGSN